MSWWGTGSLVMLGPKELPHLNYAGWASIPEEGWLDRDGPASACAGWCRREGPCRARSLLSLPRGFHPKKKAKPGTPAVFPEKKGFGDQAAVA